MVVIGERRFFERPVAKGDNSLFSFIPDWISSTFDDIFRATISYIFHQIGLDRCSKYTKITLFCVLILFPGLFLVIGLIANMIVDFIDPAPKLIPIT